MNVFCTAIHIVQSHKLLCCCGVSSSIQSRCKAVGAEIHSSLVKRQLKNIQDRNDYHTTRTNSIKYKERQEFCDVNDSAIKKLSCVFVFKRVFISALGPKRRWIHSLNLCKSSFLGWSLASGGRNLAFHTSFLPPEHTNECFLHSYPHCPDLRDTRHLSESHRKLVKNVNFNKQTFPGINKKEQDRVRTRFSMRESDLEVFSAKFQTLGLS
jgi:hypothetical protein